MVDTYIVLAILAVAVVLFVSELIPIDLTAVLAMTLLILTGVLTPEEGAAGFSNPAPLTVGAVFVLSAGLVRSGLVHKLEKVLIRLAGQAQVVQVAVLLLAITILSAFINNTAAVAMFLPVVLGFARARRINASKLLMPLSFGSILGGLCTYIGTSTNIVVGAVVAKHGLPPLRMFEFAGLGLVLASLGIIYLLTVGQKLLPARRPQASLTSGYELEEYLTELSVRPGSPLIGKTPKVAQLGRSKRFQVLEVLRAGSKLGSLLHEVQLEEGDVLRVKGNVGKLLEMPDKEGLAVVRGSHLSDQDLESEEVRLAEAIVPSSSKLVGQTLKGLDFRTRFRATALAIRRHGGPIKEKVGHVRLQTGDTLLIQGRRERLDKLRESKDLLVLTEAPPPASFRPSKGLPCVAIFLAVMALSALEVLPIMLAAVMGALLMIFTGCLSLQDAYEAIDWRIIIVISGTLSLGLALEKAGVTDLVTRQVMHSLGFLGPKAVLSVLLLLTMLTTELMSNTAAAALLAPIALSLASGLGVSPRPFAFCVAYGASASFLSPVGYQTNTLVYGPGGYKFTDYFRVGAPLSLICWIAGTLLIPVFWPF